MSWSPLLLEVMAQRLDPDYVEKRALELLAQRNPKMWESRLTKESFGFVSSLHQVQCEKKLHGLLNVRFPTILVWDPLGKIVRPTYIDIAKRQGYVLANITLF